MSTIARGYSFGATSACSYTALHALVASATVTSIPLSEFASTAHVLQVSATVPASDQGSGALWMDSTLGILRVRGGDASVRNDCPYIGPELTNNAGTTQVAGTWMAASGDNTMSPCLTAGWPEVLGVLVADTANGAKGVVRKTGIGLVNIAGPVTIGDTLVAAGLYTSWSGGRARSAKAFGSTLVTLGIEIGISLAQVGSTTALATALVWR